MKRLTLCLTMALLLLASGSALAQEFTVRGVVTDIKGQPVAGAEVAMYRGKNVKKPADFASNRTAEDGAYTVTVPAGQYWAVAVLRKGEKRFGPLELGDKHSGEAQEMVVAADSTQVHDFTIMDLREAAKQNQKKNEDLIRLSGRILDSKGQPVAMAFALADKGQHFKEFPAYVSAWSDASGAYHLLLPKGRLYLSAATAYPPAPELTLSKEVELVADMDGVDLLLP